MGMKLLNVNFLDFSLSYSLRSSVSYLEYRKKEFEDLMKMGIKFTKFRDYISEIRNGKDVYKEAYSLIPTNCFYLSVTNIKDGETLWEPIIYLREDTGELLKKYRLRNHEILITRSGSVGMVSLFRQEDIESNKTAIPSGYLIIVRVDSQRTEPTFTSYYLNSSKIQKYFRIMSIGKNQRNLSQQDIIRTPFPDITLRKQEKTVQEIKKFDTYIRQFKKELKSLQEIINEVFVKFKIKSLEKREKNEFEVFQTDLDNISSQKFLRNGPLYRLVWDVHNGLLFNQNKSKYHLIKLGELIKLHKTKTLKKGILDQEYILLDLEDIESMTGRISNEDKLVTEIGSDKTLFRDSDIIISKIDPYLGYTFLNDVSKPYIGTTELLPFKVEKERALPEFIKYLLLSKDYIEKSLLLMYGKRHPRIHILDLLNIRVPCPDLSTQKKIVEEISEEEQRNFQAQERIKKLRKDIEDFLWNSLSKR